MYLCINYNWLCEPERFNSAFNVNHPRDTQVLVVSVVIVVLNLKKIPAGVSVTFILEHNQTNKNTGKTHLKFSIVGQ